MIVSVCSNQHVLLPALALAIRRHGEELSLQQLVATFQPLWDCLRDAIHADRAACTASDTLVGIWAIRCLHRLSVLLSERTAAVTLGSGDDYGKSADADAANSWPEVRGPAICCPYNYADRPCVRVGCRALAHLDDAPRCRRARRCWTADDRSA